MTVPFKSDAKLPTAKELAQSAGGMRLSLQPDYDRLLQSCHASGRLARELKAALDATRQELTDLATWCADLENERHRLLGLLPDAAAVAVSRAGRPCRAAEIEPGKVVKPQTAWPAPQPEPEQRQDAIPATAAQQGRPVSVEPAPGLPFNALRHSR